MAFEVINKIDNQPPIWCAADGSSTYYIGQIVSVSAASKAAVPGAIKPLAVPAGIADTTNLQIPFGIVVGINNRIPVSAALGEYGTAVTTQALELARYYAGSEGMYSKGDPQLLVQVEMIGPNTILRGNIYNSTASTAPTVVSDTAGTDTTGYTSAGTTGACDFTPVADIGTIYCRFGANAGLYRTSHDTSTTAPSVTTAFPYDVALGDQFVRVPFKQGLSYIYIAGPGMFVDCSNNGATNNFSAIVTRLGLEEAGKEYVEFRFGADHFASDRA